MANSGSERNSSVAADFTFTVANSEHLPMDPTFHAGPYVPNTVIRQQGNPYVYPRKKERRCRDLRSQAIAAIFYGILMLACNVAYLVVYAVKDNAYLPQVADLTKCAGIWGGIFAVFAGIVALMTATQAEKIHPKSSIGLFIGLVASQVIALAVAVAAAVFSCTAMQINWMNPTIHLVSWSQMYDSLSTEMTRLFGEPTYWLALFSWIFAWGPVGSFIFTLKHAMIITVDVLSLK